MSTKKIRTSLEEHIERDEEYADECAMAGRRHEAESVRQRVTRAKAALSEVEAIERACKEAYRNDVNHDLRKTDRGVDLGLLIELIAKDAP